MVYQSTYHYLKCPKCNSSITREIPRFGPKQVKCGYCGTILNTSFDPWATLLFRERVSTGMSELISPSSFIKNQVMWVKFLYLILSISGVLCIVFLPIAAVLALATGTIGGFSAALMGDGGGNLAFVVISILVGLVSIFNLSRMISVSNAYSRKGTIPTWKTLGKKGQ